MTVDDPGPALTGPGQFADCRQVHTAPGHDFTCATWAPLGAWAPWSQTLRPHSTSRKVGFRVGQCSFFNMPGSNALDWPRGVPRDEWERLQANIASSAGRRFTHTHPVRHNHSVEASGHHQRLYYPLADPGSIVAESVIPEFSCRVGDPVLVAGNDGPGHHQRGVRIRMPIPRILVNLLNPVRISPGHLIVVDDAIFIVENASKPIERECGPYPGGRPFQR